MVSILAVTILSSIMSMAVLGSLRSAAIPGVVRWMNANAVAIVALVCFALQGSAPAILSVVAANELLAIAVLMVLQGCRQFFGLRPLVVAEYIGCSAVLLGMVYWTYVSPDIDARIVVVSVFHAYIYAIIGWTVRRGQAAGRPAYSYRFAMVCAWLGALGHSLRGLIYLAGFASQTALLQSTSLNITFLALGILALPALSFGMVMLSHDRMAERLEHWANFDDLTGALTRRAFVAKAEAVLDDTRKADIRLSIAIVDIDHFKSVNDRYGHATGDRVLAQFGQVIATNMHAADLFGRLGGEEFAMAFPATHPGDALARVDALRGQIQAILREALAHGSANADEKDNGLTFSAGIAEYRHGESLAHLMARADAALYSAKALGRDRVIAL
jgi:diguanylate cyclase (GGDEF)-like protein